MGHVIAWDEEDDAILRREWAAGSSASQISLALHRAGRPHRSRNACIGRVHRLGLAARYNPTAQKPISRLRVTCAKKRPLTRQAPQCTPSKPRAATPERTTGELWPLVGSTLDLQPNDCKCRWPVGDPKNEGSFGYCGRATEATYCATHAARAFVPVPPRKRNVRPLIEPARPRDNFGWRSVL